MQQLSCSKYLGISMRRTVPFLLVLFTAISVFGNHQNNAIIQYTALDTFKFEIEVIMYRDCRGLKLDPPSSNNVRLHCISSGTTVPLSMTRKSIEEVSMYDSAGACIPSNTSTTGLGIEKHVFVDTVNFNDSKFISLKSCCEIYIEVLNFCCRNSTNGTNSGMYNYAVLDLCKSNNNSSAQLKFDPLLFSCCNQPVYFNFGYIDTLDQDSLSYALVNPLATPSTAMNYATGYSYQEPLQVYYPGSLSYPYNNPEASPPIGIYLDPRSGDLIYTPTNCSQSTYIAIEVKEWRKDTNGVYQEIGKVIADALFVTRSCPTNIVPTIDGPYDYEACAGEELCFTISTDDNYFVPPPPSTNYLYNDTTSLRWNHGIAGATFEEIQDTFAQRSAMFCWTPTEDDVRSRPYYFAVQVRDNAKPINTANSKAFSVKVNAKPQTVVSINELACGEYEVESSVPSDFTGNPRYRWELLDLSDSLIKNRNIAYYKSNETFVSSHALDTIKFAKAGTYVIKHTIRTSANSCETVYLDTVSIANDLFAEIGSNDTSLCFGEETVLSVNTSGGNGSRTFSWSINQNALSLTDSNLVYTALNDTASDLIRVEITDANSCSVIQQVEIIAHEKHIKEFSDTLNTCDDSLKLILSNTYDQIEWFDNSNANEVIIRSTGWYYVDLVDQNLCEFRDSFYTYLVPEPTSGLTDTITCEDTLLLDAGEFAHYSWSNGDTTRTATFDHDVTVTLNITDEYGCSGMDQFLALFNDKPEIDLPSDLSLCCESPAYDLNDLLDVNEPKGGIWRNAAQPNSVSNDSVYASILCGPSTTSYFVSYSYTDLSNGCSNSDSILVSVHPQPRLIMDSVAYCKNVGSFEMQAELVVLPKNTTGAFYLWECVQCNDNQFKNMIVNKGSLNFPKFFLYFDEDAYTMKNPEVDTVILRYVYDDVHLCRSVATTMVEIYNDAIKPILTRRNDSLFSSVPGVQWYRNDTLLVGKDGDQLYMDIPGDYKARKISPYGCGVSEFSSIVVRTASIYSINALGLKIYPNPSSSQIFIDLGNKDFHLQELNIYDVNGKRVPYVSEQEGNVLTINHALSKGVYTMRLLINGEMYTHKLVVM